MTFMGNAPSNAMVSFAVITVQTSMSMFLLGILSILAALLISYVYTALSPETALKHSLDKGIIAANFSLALASLIFFTWGVSTLIRGAHNLPVSP